MDSDLGEEKDEGQKPPAPTLKICNFTKLVSGNILTLVPGVN